MISDLYGQVADLTQQNQQLREGVRDQQGEPIPGMTKT